MDGQCLLPNTVLPSKFEKLNFDALAGKHQNHQNFLLYGSYRLDLQKGHYAYTVHALKLILVNSAHGYL